MAEKSVEIIKKIIGAELYEEDAKKKSKAPPPKRCVVTISRAFGAGGTDIANALAETLGVKMYDRSILKAIVKSAKADKYLMERLDERVTGLVDDLVHTVFSKKGALKEDYVKHLAKVLMGISHDSGVVLGRGSHLLLADRSFRVRIDGSRRKCVKRLMERKGIKKSKAKKLMEKTNDERKQFVKGLYKRFPTDRAYYDLVINSDIYTVDQAVKVIVHAMEQAGYPTSP